jgi:hypothetical protein
LFLKPVGTDSTAKKVGLPANLFAHSLTPGNKDSANGVLHHLIRLCSASTAVDNPSTSSNFPDGPPEEIIEKNQQSCDQ